MGQQVAQCGLLVDEKMSAMSETICLPTADAAKRIGISASTLEKLRLRGDGPPVVRVSRRRVGYLVTSLDEWLRERESRPGGDPPAPH
jgi:hypothetical protein